MIGNERKYKGPRMTTQQFTTWRTLMNFSILVLHCEFTFLLSKCSRLFYCLSYKVNYAFHNQRFTASVAKWNISWLSWQAGSWQSTEGFFKSKYYSQHNHYLVRLQPSCEESNRVNRLQTLLKFLLAQPLKQHSSNNENKWAIYYPPSRSRSQSTWILYQKSACRI